MRGTLQLRYELGYHDNMHAGIQYWCSDGSSGFFVDVVWFLRTAQSVSSHSYHVEEEAGVGHTIKRRRLGVGSHIADNSPSVNSLSS